MRLPKREEFVSEIGECDYIAFNEAMDEYEEEYRELEIDGLMEEAWKQEETKYGGKTKQDWKREVHDLKMEIERLKSNFQFDKDLNARKLEAEHNFITLQNVYQALKEKNEELERKIEYLHSGYQKIITDNEKKK